VYLLHLLKIKAIPSNKKRIHMKNSFEFCYRIFVGFILVISFTLFLFYNPTKGFAQCTFAGPLPAKFEPPKGKSYIIIGQNNAAARHYLNNVGKDPMPTGVSLYMNPQNGGMLSSFYDGIHCEMNNLSGFSLDSTYKNNFLTIGYFWADAKYGAYMGDVLGGKPSAAWANDIINFANFCKKDGRPIFLRLGYEFDYQYGNYWDFYKAVWRYVCGEFKRLNVSNVAFVWQASYGNGNWASYQNFYPGDQYVDWFGYSQWDGALTGQTMITQARLKGKPLMICESTPKSQSGQWAWYSMVINQIKQNNDVIKGWTYINYNWIGEGCWNPSEGWGNSNIDLYPAIKTNWLAEIKTDFWIKGGSQTTFREMETNFGCKMPPIKAKFVFKNDISRIYMDESITVTDLSYGATTINSWNFNFGSGANTATANTSGPFTITYSSPGEKTISLTVSNGTQTDTYTTTVMVDAMPKPCLFKDDISATSKPFIDKNFINGNIYTHTITGDVWTTNVDNAGSFDYFSYHFNDAIKAVAANLTSPEAKAQLTIRARKIPNATSPSLGGSHPNALLKVDLFDDRDVPTDGSPADGLNNRFVLTDQWQVFTVDFTNKLKNMFTIDGSNGYGPLYQRNIAGIRFAVNPFWKETYAIPGYADFYSGQIEIDYIYLGIGCDGANHACITTDKGTAAPAEKITFQSCSIGDMTSYLWNFGSGASMTTANGIGPYILSYNSPGTKTITLSINGPSGADTYTSTVNISACKAAYYDQFTNSKVVSFVAGASAFSAAINPDSTLKITSTGNQNYDFASIAINDGNMAKSIDISTNPVLYIRAKASVPMALRVSLEDTKGVQVQTSNLQNNIKVYDPLSGSFNFPVGTSWKVYKVNYAKNFWDEWITKSKVDSTHMAKVILRPNPAWGTFPIFGFTSSFVGTLWIDYILIAGDTSTCLGKLGKYDCNGDLNGTAFIDSCGRCAGGKTGRAPITNAQACLTRIIESQYKTFIQVQPNPFNNSISIQANTKTSIRITNLMGQIFLKTIVEKNQGIEVGDQWPEGIYFIEVNEGDGPITLKIIKL
jgi:PKD repeat protein